MEVAEGGVEEKEEEARKRRSHMTAVACLLVLEKDTGVSKQTISLSFYRTACPSLPPSSSTLLTSRSLSFPPL